MLFDVATVIYLYFEIHSHPWSGPRLAAAVPTTTMLLARVTGAAPGQYVVRIGTGGIRGEGVGGARRMLRQKVSQKDDWYGRSGG